MNTIKFAVVGCGHIGRRYIQLIKNNPCASLVAISDIKYVELFPVFNSIDSLLSNSTEIDVVIIATPNGLHAQHAIKALYSGKHVVIEKPMALTSMDAQRIINAANTAKRHVFTVMQNRHSPPAQWLKELVNSGKLGTVFLVQVNCFWNRDQRYYTTDSWHGTKDMDGGTLFTQFSHFIDILWWLFGDIKNISARFFDFNHRHLTQFEDSGFVQFDFVNGGSGVLNYSTSVWDANMESSITIIAENGSVRIGGQYMNRIEYCHIKNYTPPDLQNTNAENDYGTHKGSAANHKYVIQNVVNVLRGKESVHTTAEEGMQVVDIINRIYSLK